MSKTRTTKAVAPSISLDAIINQGEELQKQVQAEVEDFNAFMETTRAEVQKRKARIAKVSQIATAFGLPMALESPEAASKPSGVTIRLRASSTGLNPDQLAVYFREEATNHGNHWDGSDDLKLIGLFRREEPNLKKWATELERTPFSVFMRLVRIASRYNLSVDEVTAYRLWASCFH